MKKVLKAFTLVELVIVMAIIVIISAAMMQMMVPIRTVFVDSSYYEEQRNIQNGMIQYITESTRYATNLGVYYGGNVDDAMDDFETLVGTDFDKGKTHVITIDNTNNYKNRNKAYRGRLLRSKSIAADYTTTDRVALGEAFYGDNTYSIDLKMSSADSLSISVASLHANIFGDNTVDSEKITESPNQSVLTTGEVFLKNISIGGKFEVDIPSGASTTTKGKNTYIVFTLPE